ncbi:hypothetical protein QUF72_06840 [Desulfobacterales bacterium HSG2]|nr:hypothetical protein [Desulfobacterales bacterium HSG2]
MPKKNIASLVMENKSVFIIIAVALFLIELEIFAVAAMKSGRDYKLQVIDAKGNLIHETDGKSLSDFNKYYFEKTFGPFEQYEVKLVTKDVPFPFRAWFVAAICIPMGIILLFAFAVKAYIALFYGEEEERKEKENLRDVEYGTRLEKIVTSVSGFNIFTIGFLVFLLAISYWIIPEVIIYFGKLGEETILRYKWFFLAGIIAVFSVLVWVIFLRYLLAKKTIESQVEVDKYRMKLEYKHGDSPLQLEYNRNKTGNNLIGWDKDKKVGSKDKSEIRDTERPKKTGLFKKTREQ